MQDFFHQQYGKSEDRFLDPVEINLLDLFFSGVIHVISWLFFLILEGGRTQGKYTIYLGCVFWGDFFMDCTRVNHHQITTIWGGLHFSVFLHSQPRDYFCLEYLELGDIERINLVKL